MSGNHDPIQRIASPVSSGRTSPSPYRSRQRDEDNLLKKDKGYRRYASTIERVLSQFDTSVEEWADYITFLGRFLKALSVKPSGFTEIPHKFLVAKRLSQCLNPVLPSGVHQKTLEVYAYVFSTLGKDGLAIDLGLYLPGLSPILSFAALSVKPNVLNIFETYIVPLRPSAIRPALKSILLALLPGLEEENSEEFDRTMRILSAFKFSIAQDAARLEPDGEQTAACEQYFWQCMFLASITSTSRRTGALEYLIRNLPQLGNSVIVNGAKNGTDASARLREAIDSVVSPEPGLLVRCFCAGLQDDRPLIQRGFLDLLVTHLPLNSVVLQEKVIQPDLERLVVAATSVVARKDMSLNRRLWSWFLGPEPTPEVNASLKSPSEVVSPTHNIVAYQTAHFEKYGLRPLNAGILTMINKRSPNPTDRTKALRICLSLMDRWEIGGLVVPKIFLPAMKSVWIYQSSSADLDSKHEVLRSANMFFDGVESSLIWSETCELTARAISISDLQVNESQEMLEMITFMITNFNIREEEMQTIHMPLAVLMILLLLRERLATPASAFKFGKSSTISYALKIAIRLVDLIPPRALARSNSVPETNLNETHKTSEARAILDAIQIFYRDNKGNIDLGRPFSDEKVGQMMLEESLGLTSSIIKSVSSQANTELDYSTTLFKMLVKKAEGHYQRPNLDGFLDMLTVSFGKGQNAANTSLEPFAIVSAKVSVLEAIMSCPGSAGWVDAHVSRIAIPSLVQELWPSLSSSRPKHNVEAARSLWALYNLSREQQLAQNTIVTLMVHPEDDPNKLSVDEENARRFATLWAHSQIITSTSTNKTGSLRNKSAGSALSKAITVEPLLERSLLLLLDYLWDSQSTLFSFVVGWIQSLPSLTSILNLLVTRLASLYPVVTLLRLDPASNENLSDDPDGLPLCHYYLQTIYNLIQYSNDGTWEALGMRSQFAGKLELISTQQDLLAEISIKLLQDRRNFTNIDRITSYQLSEVCLALLRQFFDGPHSAVLLARSLEIPLISELVRSIEFNEHHLQTSLMETILTTSRPRYQKDVVIKSPRHQRTASKDLTTPSSPIRASAEGDEKGFVKQSPPSALLDCILLGLKSSSTRLVLESWTTFLSHCLPFYGEGLFQILLPLISGFCDTLSGLLGQLDAVYQDPNTHATEVLDPTITILLNGLEQTLATAHDVLTTTEANAPPPKSPEPQQAGFFGSMAGVFTAEAAKPKAMTANNRLTVLLCFKDAMKICYSIWAWGDSDKENRKLDNSAQASHKWIALRLRNRTRRIFEHLFAAEALECLETLIELWQEALLNGDSVQSDTILSLLSVLESSRPKITTPNIFNAIYSRTKPAALEANRTSTLTSNLSNITLTRFLVAYTKALDDDAMNEIWNDCITFLKDLVGDALPHSQTLPLLIEFTAVLGIKVDNTTFGEQAKLRKELGDLFGRLLRATLTTRPMATTLEVAGPEKQSETANGTVIKDPKLGSGTESLVSVLATIVPNLSKVLVETDRVSSISSQISVEIISPIFRAKIFPENIHTHTLELVQALLNLPEATKFVKRDIDGAFNDNKFFSSSLSLVTQYWLTILQSWCLADKEKMPELLSRLVTPAAAGVLGIGANSARLESDKRTQLNLRRIALLILASAKDTYVVNLPTLQEKIVDLLHATSTSSPSSVTRAEIYMLLRALVLKTSSTHLSPFWPTIQTELFEALSIGYPSKDSDQASPTCLLQACKLLDTLLVLGIDDFQMQEWLFISDTTDAVYRPPEQASVALVDDLAQALDEQPDSQPGLDSNSLILATTTNSGSSSAEVRRPLLTSVITKDVPKDEIVDRLVRPFFRQLSIAAFESTYGLQNADWDACSAEVVADLFDDGTLV